MHKGWTIRDLYDCKRNLVGIMESLTREEDLSYAKYVLGTIDDIIGDFKGGSMIPSLSYVGRLEKLEKELSEFKNYYNIIEDFALTIYKFDEQLQRIEDMHKKLFDVNKTYSEITGATISNDRALSITNIFYSQFDSSLYPLFLELFSQKDTSIRFVDKLNGSNEADSFYFDFVKRYFIQVVKSDDLNKVFSMIHEFGHVLSYVMNPKAYLLQKNCMFDEVAAVFPEMLSYETNPGAYDPMHLLFERYASLITMYNYANALLLHDAYVDIWKDNKRKVNKKFFKMIKTELDEDVEDVDDSLDTYIDSCGQYILAYLTSIELLNIYRRDKGKALEIYRNFIMIPYTDDVYDYIRSEMVLGEHLEGETKILLDGFEKKLVKAGGTHV